MNRDSQKIKQETHKICAQNIVSTWRRVVGEAFLSAKHVGAVGKTDTTFEKRRNFTYVIPMLAAKLCGSYDSYKSNKVFAWRSTRHDEDDGQTKIRFSLFWGWEPP